MKKKVIALSGVSKRDVSNVGRSDTINKVYDLLKLKYPDATERHEKFGLNDIKSVLTIKGIKIGIESQGSKGSRLRESLDLFIMMECKVIICASTTRGDTFNAVKELEHSHEVIWFQHNVLKYATASEQAASNLAMAKKIVGETEKIIK